MKAYVVIATRFSYGVVKPGGPLGYFRKESTNAGTDFPLETSSLHNHHTYITQQQSILRHLLVSTVTHHPAECPAEVVQKL